MTYSLLEEMRDSGNYRFQVTSPRKLGPGEPFLHRIDPNCQGLDYKGKFGWRSFRTFRKHVASLAKDSDNIWITGTCACSLAAIQNQHKLKVLSHHYHHFENRTSRLKWFGFYNLLCRQLTAITYPTDFTRSEALRIAPWLRERAHVVPNGHETFYTNETEHLQSQAKARKALGLPAEAFIVGNGGWLIPRKRMDVFLETAALIKSANANAYFVICGDGPLRGDLTNRARELGILDSVKFVGWTDDMSQYYQAWDICLFNSDFDTIPRIVTEAASYGCVIVASLLYGGLSEFVTSGYNGILLTRHDTTKLSSEIIDLSKNKARASEFREASAERLRSKFSMEQNISFYRSIFS